MQVRIVLLRSGLTNSASQWRHGSMPRSAPNSSLVVYRAGQGCASEPGVKRGEEREGEKRRGTAILGHGGAGEGGSDGYHSAGALGVGHVEGELSAIDDFGDDVGRVEGGTDDCFSRARGEGHGRLLFG
jgi:hypothetical protein